jgi:hypothetical protein
VILSPKGTVDKITCVQGLQRVRVQGARALPPPRSSLAPCNRQQVPTCSERRKGTCQRLSQGGARRAYGEGARARLTPTHHPFQDSSTSPHCRQRGVGEKCCKNPGSWNPWESFGSEAKVRTNLRALRCYQMMVPRLKVPTVGGWGVEGGARAHPPNQRPLRPVGNQL